MRPTILVLLLWYVAALQPANLSAQARTFHASLGAGGSSSNHFLLALTGLAVTGRFGAQLAIERRSEGRAAECGIADCRTTSYGLVIGPRLILPVGSATAYLGPSVGVTGLNNDIGLVVGVDAGLYRPLRGNWIVQMDGGIRTYLDSPEGWVLLSLGRFF